MKKCPFCAEEIQSEAIKCRYCGEFLNREETDDSEWGRFVKMYREKTELEQRGIWEGLTEEQREYLAAHYGI